MSSFSAGGILYAGQDHNTDVSRLANASRRSDSAMRLSISFLFLQLRNIPRARRSLSAASGYVVCINVSISGRFVCTTMALEIIVSSNPPLCDVVPIIIHHGCGSSKLFNNALAALTVILSIPCISTILKRSVGDNESRDTISLAPKFATFHDSSVVIICS